MKRRRKRAVVRLEEEERMEEKEERYLRRRWITATAMGDLLDCVLGGGGRLGKMESMERTCVVTCNQAENQWPHEHDNNCWPAVIIRWFTAPDNGDVVPIDLDDIVQSNLQDRDSEADS